MGALVPITFLAVTVGSFLLLNGFVRAGQNREDAVLTPRGPRPLIFGGLTRALAGMFPLRPETRERYRKFLRQAGHYHAQALDEYLALRNALVVGSFLLTLAAIVVATEPGEPLMYQIGVAGLVVIVLLYSLPRLGLEAAANSRIRRIEQSLPDALDMITMCTSAGLPLQNAILRISDELRSSHPDLAFELRIVGRHAETNALSSAFQHFARRLEVPDIHSVASMVWQAEQHGSSVAGAFHAFSDQVRLTRRQRAEEAANKAAFKMLFPLVLCLMPAVYLVLLGPAVLELRNFLRTAREPGGPLAMPDFQALSTPPVSPELTGPTPLAPPQGAPRSPGPTALPPLNP